MFRYDADLVHVHNNEWHLVTQGRSSSEPQQVEDWGQSSSTAASNPGHYHSTAIFTGNIIL